MLRKGLVFYMSYDTVYCPECKTDWDVGRRELQDLKVRSVRCNCCGKAFDTAKVIFGAQPNKNEKWLMSNSVYDVVEQS